MDAVDAVSAVMPRRPPDRRERRREANHEWLLDCAIALFVEQGYDETSMNDIAERADVARATVFNHFPRKRSFLEKWGDRRRAALRDALAGQDPTADAATALADVFAFWADMYERDASVSRPIVRYWILAGGPLLPSQSDASTLFAETIRVGQWRGDLRADADADAAGLVVLDAGLAVLTRWAASDEVAPGELGRALAKALRVVLTGLQTRTSSQTPPGGCRSRLIRAGAMFTCHDRFRDAVGRGGRLSPADRDHLGGLSRVLQRVRRLRAAGFDAQTARHLSDLHTPNLM